MNIICKVVGHNIARFDNELICKRCGKDISVITMTRLEEGKAQFIPPKSFKEKFEESKNIDDFIN